ncbi:MAG: MBL fold metallo-hydrolase [Candidatus Viridilinea halotolerans]|uniref:MBL fold metallo-hydrolase n=1 Tax=Candidatus Viridilinea halotolerans TaxID=2491704 RepID=A0A426U621_9CHLR|nr:MAG: MBL fold metallo-hydrolase [Candidatus Viridilinea halotolerans]
MELLPVDAHITAIDHNLLGLPGIGVTYVVRGESIALIETGTALTVPHTLAGLEKLGIQPEAVDHIICTHVHMDHAGGAGYLAAALPRASVHIHSMSAPHLVDPAKLMVSVRRAVGEEAWPLHGDVKPIPEERMRPAEEMRLDLGRDVILEAIATPGHSPDHLSYRDLKSGGLFIGDAAGLAMDRWELALPVTPVPAYDLAAHRSTIAMLRSLNLPRIYVTHHGPHDDVAFQLSRASEQLDALVDLIDRAIADGESDIASLAARWMPYPDDGPAGLVARSWSQMSIAGMLRYETKRRQG